MSCKKIVILGSTGSIGINTLKVVERYPEKFKVVGLTAYNNVKLLAKQAKKFQPSHLGVGDKGIEFLKKNVDTKKTKIIDVKDDLKSMVSLKNVDVVVIAMRGAGALGPFLAAVRAGKIVAPANKEALVMAGDILMKEARKYGATVIPIDSEQSAIFQCLNGQKRSELKKVILTASGGALLNVPKSRFNNLTVQQILSHPRWKMGKKITVDSATMMNKGFELIEAQKLFGLKTDQIDVLIHPEAIIHSMVEYIDGSIIAQLGITDMRLPIQYALTYPYRLCSGLKSMDFVELKQLTFQEPDYKKFPSLELAFYALKEGGSLPCVLNAADEEAVEAFLENRLNFNSIYDVVSKVVKKHRNVDKPSIKQILDVDIWAREETRKVMSQL